MAVQRPVTVADVRKMLNGEPMQESGKTGKAAIPADAVSATVETVKEGELKTTETVEVVAPAVPRKTRSN